MTVCEAVSGRGGSWGEDGTIVFAPDLRAALFKVPSGGGTPQPLTRLDQKASEATQRWPQLLPGGKAILFTSDTHGGNYEDAEIVAYELPSGQKKTVVRGGYFARYSPTGHIVYMHEGTLFALPFDAKRLEATGSPVPVLEGVATFQLDGTAQYSFSLTSLTSFAAKFSRRNDRSSCLGKRQSSMQNQRDPTSFSNADSSRIVRPRDLALSYFEPGSAPTTT